MRIKKNISWGIITLSNIKFSKLITRTVRQTVRRITNEILGVKGLIYLGDTNLKLVACV